MIGKLDKIDRKILQILSENGRASYSEISKKIKLSKKAVMDRINNYINKEIISGFYPIIDFYKLGYKYCRYFINLHNISQEKKEELTKYMKDRKDVFWLFSFYGNYDFGCGVMANSLAVFKETTSNIEKKYGTYINSKKESVLITLETLNYSFSEDFPKGKIIKFGESKEIDIVKLDDLDIKILEQLCINPRETSVKIALNVGSSAKVVMYRIKKLEENEVILGYKPGLNYKNIGFGHYKILFNINLTKDVSKEKIKEYLRSEKEVIYIVDEIGSGWDLDIETLFPNIEDLYQFVEKMKFKFPETINGFEIITFEKMLKVNYLPNDILI